MNDDETEQELASLDALDLLEAAFKGDDDRFIALLPTSLEEAELMLVAVAEEAQLMLGMLAPAPASGAVSDEDRTLWARWVLNLRRLDVSGAGAVADALRGMSA